MIAQAEQEELGAKDNKRSNDASRSPRPKRTTSSGRRDSRRHGRTSSSNNRSDSHRSNNRGMGGSTTERTSHSDGDREAKSRARRTSARDAEVKPGAMAESSGSPSRALESSERSRHRSDRDREAKSRASRKEGDLELKPGAVAEASRSSQATERSEKSHRRSDRDRESKSRARRTSARDAEVKPGAVPETIRGSTGEKALGNKGALSASISNRDRESKRKSKMGSAPSPRSDHSRKLSKKLLEEDIHLSERSSKIQDDGAKRKSKMGSAPSPRSDHSRKLSRKLLREGIHQIQEDDVEDNNETTLQAFAVEDVPVEENEVFKEQQAVIARLQNQVEHIASNRNHTGGEDHPENREEYIDGEPKPSSPSNKKSTWKKVLCVALVLLAIGGGVVGYILSSSSNEATDKNRPKDSTPVPSGSPTEFQQPMGPSEEDCEAISSGMAVADQDFLSSERYSVDFEVTLAFATAEANWSNPFTAALQSTLIPRLAGCKSPATRRLRERAATGAEDGSQQRLLQLTNFIVANGLVGDATVANGNCGNGTNSLCFQVNVVIDLWLVRDNVQEIEILGFIADSLGESPVTTLNLQVLMSSVVLIGAKPDEAGESPSPSPTGSESIEPVVTIAPSVVGPSATPTQVPTKENPATMAPTFSDTTENPTESPTTLAPVTEAPTFAPVVGPTPPPTQVPTRNPTLSPTSRPTPQATPDPTLSPTPGPTLQSTPGPTLSPTLGPTLSPTSAPTQSPTSGPTKSPSSSPSVVPSPAPSSAPSSTPSSSPTEAQSLITPSATATESSDYVCISSLCSGGTLQVPDGLAYRAIDGNKDPSYYSGSMTHTRKQYDSWWKVTGISGTVSTVKVWNRNDSSISPHMEGATVSLKDGNGLVIASQTLSGVQLVYTLDFGSVSGVAEVRIQLEGVGNVVLAEVEVLGSADESLLSVSSVASQSSNLDCTPCVTDNTGSGPEVAIDGNTDGHYPNGSVMHTFYQVDPWLLISLGLTATVTKIVVWNRTDCCQDRLMGGKIELLDSSNAVLHTATIYSAAPSTTYEISSVTDVTAIRIRLETGDQMTPLAVAEVEAFGQVQS